MKLLSDPTSVIGELDAEHCDFEKAKQGHAEKQVQVAANNTNQRVDGHLWLLVHVCVRERVVVELKSKHVGLLVRLKLALIGAQRVESGTARERILSVQSRRRKNRRIEIFVQRWLNALEWTLGKTVEREPVKVEERLVAELHLARRNGRRKAVVVVADLHAHLIARAVAHLGYARLVAEFEARVAIVREVARDEAIVQAAVGQRLHQLAVFVHRALAVGVRPRVVLCEDGALDGEGHALTGRNFVRRHAVVVRILGLVLDKHFESFVYIYICAHS